jgi:hypothetical protein
VLLFCPICAFDHPDARCLGKKPRERETPLRLLIIDGSRFDRIPAVPAGALFPEEIRFFRHKAILKKRYYLIGANPFAYVVSG